MSRVPALPDDAGIDALAAAERASLSRVWLQRAQGELGTAGVFRTIAEHLRSLRSPLATLAEKASDDEHAHAELARQVASRYAAEELPLPAPAPVDPPRFGAVSDDVARSLLVVANCCVNETIANVYLQACHAEATAPLARAALHALWRDEVDHARIGWAFLAGPENTDALRGVVRRALPVLVRMVRGQWLDPGPSHDEPPPGHGWLPAARVAALCDDAIDSLVLPGFSYVGFALTRGECGLDAR